MGISGFFPKPKEPKYHVFFKLSVQEVVIRMHGLMHDSHFGRYKTLNFNIEKQEDNTFTLIVIYSETKLSKKKLTDMLTKIPSHEDRTWNGGR